MEIFPAVEISFLTKEGEQLTLFLVLDSGAGISALPKTDAVVFGIDVEKGIPMLISGIGDKAIPAWRHEIPAIFRQDKITLPVAFLDRESSPRVLGREGIFDRFTVIFEETERRSALIQNATRESRSVKQVIDKM